jgi:hypothetical protein
MVVECLRLCIRQRRVVVLVEVVVVGVLRMEVHMVLVVQLELVVVVAVVLRMVSIRLV